MAVLLSQTLMWLKLQAAAAGRTLPLFYGSELQIRWHPVIAVFAQICLRVSPACDEGWKGSAAECGSIFTFFF